MLIENFISFIYFAIIVSFKHCCGASHLIPTTVLSPSVLRSSNQPLNTASSANAYSYYAAPHNYQHNTRPNTNLKFAASYLQPIVDQPRAMNTKSEQKPNYMKKLSTRAPTKPAQVEFDGTAPLANIRYAPTRVTERKPQIYSGVGLHSGVGLKPINSVQLKSVLVSPTKGPKYVGYGYQRITKPTTTTKRPKLIPIVNSTESLSYGQRDKQQIQTQYQSQPQTQTLTQYQSQFQPQTQTQYQPQTQTQYPPQTQTQYPPQTQTQYQPQTQTQYQPQTQNQFQPQTQTQFQNQYQQIQTPYQTQPQTQTQTQYHSQSQTQTQPQTPTLYQAQTSAQTQAQTQAQLPSLPQWQQPSVQQNYDQYQQQTQDKYSVEPQNTKYFTQQLSQPEQRPEFRVELRPELRQEYKTEKSELRPEATPEPTPEPRREETRESQKEFRYESAPEEQVLEPKRDLTKEAIDSNKKEKLSSVDSENNYQLEYYDIQKDSNPNPNLNYDSLLQNGQQISSNEPSIEETNGESISENYQYFEHNTESDPEVLEQMGSVDMNSDKQTIDNFDGNGSELKSLLEQFIQQLDALKSVASKELVKTGDNSFSYGLNQPNNDLITESVIEPLVTKSGVSYDEYQNDRSFEQNLSNTETKTYKDTNEKRKAPCNKSPVFHAGALPYAGA